MLTVESIEQIKKSLSDLGGSDKAMIQTTLTALSDFKAIENRVTELRKLIKKLIETKQLDKYIESDGYIYCLETLEKFELITATDNELKDIVNLEKKINQSIISIKEMIEKKENQLTDLYIKRDEILETLFSDAKDKAVKNDEMLILQQQFGDHLVLLKDK